VARQHLAAWLSSGEITMEKFVEGFANARASLIRVFAGLNTGGQFPKLRYPPLTIAVDVES
jgi:NADPH-dependent curcumin reductase CurA